MFDLRLLIITQVNYHLAGQFNNGHAVGEGILFASSNIEWTCVEGAAMIHCAYLLSHCLFLADLACSA